MYRYACIHMGRRKFVRGDRIDHPPMVDVPPAYGAMNCSILGFTGKVYILRLFVKLYEYLFAQA